MGMKVRILEFTGCTNIDAEEDKTIIHGMGENGGDMSTLCGMPFCDEVKKWKETGKALSCKQCIGVLEHTTKYEFRKGKWL